VPHTPTLKLVDLARRAGVSPRTVRYYVQRGLLPPPTFHGPDTVYEADHLLRLRAIRRLQERFLLLEEIQAQLERASPVELHKIADGKDVTAPSRRVAAAEPSPPSRSREEHWTRWQLLPGLELHVSKGADSATRALAEQLRALGHEVRHPRGGSKR
jgi:Ca-activated chloride channel family protein